jgi:hypothetical protein
MHIVERLRNRTETFLGFLVEVDPCEAADEIERLQKEVMAWWEETELMRGDLAHYSSEIERLREALIMVRDADDDCHKDGFPTIPPMARAKIDKALGEKE